MSLSYLRGAALLALLPLAAMAQQGEQAGPADPNAPVPAAQYISVFKNYRPANDAQVSPDQTWRAANAAVASQNAHAGHQAMLDSSAQPSGRNMPPPVAPAHPHGGHGGRHH